MKLSSLFFLCLPTFILAQTFQPDNTAFNTPVTVAAGLSASVVFSNLTSPRGITFDGRQNLLVVERGAGVSSFSHLLTPASGWQRKVVVKNDKLTHGIQVDGTTLYVSTASDVLAYSYDPVTQSTSADGFPLITGLPADGELITHTLELVRDDSGTVVAILVGSGPETNIDVSARDPGSGRSQIRIFSLITAQPYPLQWSNGVVIAYGIRNPAGFTFPNVPLTEPIAAKALLIVENGASIQNVTGFTPTFANDNPADEIETLVWSNGENPPPSFGFPDCATLWNPQADPTGDPQYTSLPRGAQFSLNLPTLPLGVRGDAWCRNSTNNRPPSFNFQAHSAPLDIKQYESSVFPEGALPAAWSGDIFVSFHGSANRTPPTGYGVVHVPYPFGNTGTGTALGYTFLIQAANLKSCPGKCIRPVGLAFGAGGRLFVSSDSTGELFVIQATNST